MSREEQIIELKKMRLSYDSRESLSPIENRIGSSNQQYQVKRATEEIDSFDRVQSFINNIAFPKSLEELMFFASEHGCYNIEDILYDTITTWTAPRWAKIGDVVFFMHTKTAKSAITALRTQLNRDKEFYSQEEYDVLTEWIDAGLALYSKYGGKIFAVGRVCGAPEYIEDDDELYEDASYYHWSSKIYADIEIDVLENPIDISEFNSFIMVSRQGAITGVFGKEFDQLKEVIKAKNPIPNYLEKAKASPLPLGKVNPENWISLTNEYRRSFMLESQFRSYYVDYFLKEIGDNKTIFKECRCKKANLPDTFADNVIKINGKFLPVEVKLSVSAERNIKGQVQQYCNTDEIILDSRKNRVISSSQAYDSNVLIIDTERVYMYDNMKNTVDEMVNLDDIISISDVKLLREKIIERI